MASERIAVCPNIRYDFRTNTYEKCRHRHCRYAHTLSQIRVHYTEQCLNWKRHQELKWDCKLYHHFREAPYYYYIRTRGLTIPLPHYDLSLTYEYANEVPNWPFYRPNLDREYISPCTNIRYDATTNTYQPCRDKDCQQAHCHRELNIPIRRKCVEPGCTGCSRFHGEKETVVEYFVRHNFLSYPLPAEPSELTRRIDA